MYYSRKWLDNRTYYRLIVLWLVLLTTYTEGSSQCQSNSTTIIPVNAENTTYVTNPLTKNMTCTWNITAPVGNIISLYLTFFGQTTNQTVCEKNGKVKVYDGSTTSSNVLIYSCDNPKLNLVNYKFYTSSSNALIELQIPAVFDTQGNVLFMRADLNTFKKSTCYGGKVTNLTASTSMENSIKSPYYSVGYPKDSNCAWKITAPPGQIIRLKARIRISCNLNESLNVYDSDTSDPKNRIASLCTASRYQTIYSRGETIYIEFITNTTEVPANKKNYFLIDYQSYTPACVDGQVTNLTALTNTVQNITSPYSDERYPKDSSCAWRITAPHGQIIKVQIKSKIRCSSDERLYIYDSNANVSKQLLAKVCDESHFRTFYSMGGAMYIEMVDKKMVLPENDKNYFIINYNSFKAATRCSASNTAEENLNIIIDGPTKSGIIQSPNFPKAFPSNIHCKWHFFAPVGHTIKIFVETINLDAGRGCIIDPYLRLFDGLKNSIDALISSIQCRYSTYSALKPSFYALSAGDNFLMEFKSGSGVPTGYGFSANYTFQTHVSSGTCGKGGIGTINLKGQGASFYSPGYTTQNKNMTCLWNITVDPGHIIRLSTIRNNLALSCSYEYVKAYDGSTVNSPVLGTICSKSSIDPVYSSGNNMIVQMVTGAVTTGRGIYMEYQAVKYQPTKYYCTENSWVVKIENVPSAKIVSPWYPIGYPNNIRCIWRFIAPFGYKAQAVITKLQLQGSKNCSADKVAVSGGVYSFLSPVHKTMCGLLMSPFSITAPSQNLAIDLRTDWRGQYPGFEAVFGSIKDDSFGDCRVQGKDNFIPLNTSSGVIFSPRYPHGIPSNMMCTWLLTAPEGRYIRLDFNHFDLDYSCSGKSKLEIRDGKMPTSSLIGTFCKTNIPKSIISSGRYMWLRFSSTEQTRVDKGFNLTYSTTITSLPLSVSCKGKDLKKVESSSGEIASHEYPLNYGNDMECQWRITVPDGKRVKLTFESFNIQKTSGCTGDYVEIFDGMTSFSDSLGKLCGDTTPEPVHSSSTWMYIKFKTDSTGQFPGFKAKFEAVLSVQSIILIVVFTLLGFGALCTCIGWCLKSNVGHSHDSVPGPEGGAASTAGSNIELTSKM